MVEKGKGDSSVPYIFKDEEMQQNFQAFFLKRPIAFGRSFKLESFSFLPRIIEVFEFQGWADFLRISEDLYTILVAAFYSTLESADEDNTFLRSIVGSFELQVLPSNLVSITNTPNEGVIYRGGSRW